MFDVGHDIRFLSCNIIASYLEQNIGGHLGSLCMRQPSCITQIGAAVLDCWTH